MEEWRTVPEFPSYEVSPAGLVRRVVAARGARVGHVLRVYVDRYPQVHLYRSGRQFCRHVHVLVAGAFLGPRPNGQEVNHRDGNRLNPSVANLEYVTAAENGRHAADTGLAPCGERNGMAILDIARGKRWKGLVIVA